MNEKEVGKYWPLHNEGWLAYSTTSPSAKQMNPKMSSPQQLWDCFVHGEISISWFQTTSGFLPIPFPKYFSFHPHFGLLLVSLLIISSLPFSPSYDSASRNIKHHCLPLLSQNVSSSPLPGLQSQTQMLMRTRPEAWLKEEGTDQEHYICFSTLGYPCQARIQAMWTGFLISKISRKCGFLYEFSNL